MREILISKQPSPVSLSEAKNWLRVDYTEDDSLITELIESATTQVEEFTGYCMREKVYEFYYDEAKDFVEFPYRPLAEVQLVEYYDGSGWLGFSNYRIINGRPCGIYLIEIPAAADQPASFKVRARFEPTLLDEKFKTAVLWLIGLNYEFREGGEVKRTMDEIPVWQKYLEAERY